MFAFIFLFSISALTSSAAFTFQPGRKFPGSIKSRHYDTKTTFLVREMQGDTSTAAASSAPAPPSEKPRTLNNTMLNGEDVEEGTDSFFLTSVDEKSKSINVTSSSIESNEAEDLVSKKVTAFLVSAVHIERYCNNPCLLTYYLNDLQ